jgi:hypothetical protein
MIAACYLHVGKGRNGFKVAASLRSNASPLKETRGYSIVEIPTVQFKLKLDLKPDAFAAAEVLVPVETADLQPLAATAESSALAEEGER